MALKHFPLFAAAILLTAGAAGQTQTPVKYKAIWEPVNYPDDRRSQPGVGVEPFVGFARGVAVEGGAVIRAFSHLEGALVRAGAIIGPYARLRPGADLRGDAHIGNFVEVKASTFGRGSKANHLAYVGDSSVGSNVNIGAGTITCNYDGANKHRTVIEDDVHIGSDVQLVAPVTVGKGATIGAGATITKDVPPGGLTLTEKKQVSKPDWERPRKKK